MRKRLLLIGPGGLGRARAACFRNNEGVELAGVVARTEASAARAASDFGLPAHGTDVDAVAAEAQPDAVAITVVNSAHHRYIMWALRHDLDVFVDGPMVVNSTQAVEVVALARERGRIVEVGFQRRYHPVIQQARDLIQGGEHGPLIYGEVEFFWHMAPPPGEPLPWYLDDARSGGMAVCHMSYGLNTLRWVLGDPQRVFATGNALAFPPEQVAMDTLSVSLLYDSGSVGHVVANFSAPDGFPSGTMKAHCVSGGFSLQIIHDVAGTFWKGNDVMEVTAAEPAAGDPEWGANDLQAQCDAFVAALDTRQGLLNPPEDSLFELRLIESALASAREGQAVTLG